MGIFTGFISAVCLLILIAKFAARKSKNKRIDSFLAKLHKPISTVFLIVSAVHTILVIPTLKTRSILVTLSGFTCLAVGILIIVFYHTVKEAKAKIRLHRALALILSVFAVLHIVTYFIDFKNYKEKIAGIEIPSVDLSEIKDGKYIGEYDAGYIYAKVRVNVKDGVITNVDLLEHREDRGKKAESITDEIVRGQSLKVDAVSGATNSCLVIEKACANALCK